MRTLNAWLNEYSESHSNGLNTLIHWICVPLIQFSLLGLLWPLQTPAVLNDLLFPSNWSITAVLFGSVYYFILSPAIALGMIGVCGCMLLLIEWLDSMPLVLWQVCLIIFILAWTGQFIGHVVEGRRPSFFRDVQFLLIGPLWLLAKIYRKLKISY